MARPRSALRTVGIAAGVALAVLIACVAIGLTHHIHRTVASPDEAARAFAAARAHIARSRPLIEIDAELQLSVIRDLLAARRPFAALHTLSYNPRTRRLIRTDWPMWLLRAVTANGRIRLMSIDIIQKDGERVTLDDLERHGAGLVFDAALPDGRMLAWID